MKIKFQSPVRVEGLSEKVAAFRANVAIRKANDEHESDLLDEYDAARTLFEANPTDPHRQQLVTEAAAAIQNHYASEAASKSFKRQVDRINRQLAEQAKNALAEQMASMVQQTTATPFTPNTAEV